MTIGIGLSICHAKEKNDIPGNKEAMGHERKIISLAGKWECKLDPDNQGLSERWQNSEIKSSAVTLPGTTQTNEIGPVPPKKLISSLTPTTEYLGPAWYQRDIELSKDDCRRHIGLFLERCGWVSAVWLNGTELGTRDSLVSPHVYDLTAAAKPGKNKLTVMIDNSNRKTREKVSTDDGSNTEDLVLKKDKLKRLNCGGHHAVFGGPCFNGITGRIELQIRSKARITALQVYPDIQNRKVRVKVEHTHEKKVFSKGMLLLKIRDIKKNSVIAEKKFSVRCERGKLVDECELSLGDDMRLWDEFDPYLYELTAGLKTAMGLDTQSTEFGMRQLSQVGTQLAVNGRTTFLRGELECFVHPLTGYPPTDLDYWMHIFGIYKEHGLNHVRFHTCCPPGAAFAAADRLGFFLNVELPGCSGYEPQDAETLNYLQAEALRILRTFGNHPSFCMLTMGNELLYNGETESSKSQVILMKRVARCRKEDPRHWYCCTAQAHTEGRDDDFYVSAWPKGGRWGSKANEGEPLTGIRWSGFDVVDSSRFNTRPPETASDYRAGIAGIDKPVFTHEVGQWAVYPDIREIKEFTGPFKANNLEIIRDFMKKKGTLELADDFVRASGNLSLLLYKEEIESALRTPGLGGFQLLGFHDHPPQGTSTIGIVTALRKSKGLITAEQFRRFCSETVPLARLPRRTFTSKDSLTADVEVAHYGPTDLENTEFCWRLSTENGQKIAVGTFKRRDIPTGGLTRIGKVLTPLSSVDVPVKVVLRVFAQNTEIDNSWDLWVYPYPDMKKEKPVRWVRRWSSDIAKEVAAGSTIVVELPKEQIPAAARGCFTTVFWNPIMKRHQHAFTMGILCDPDHSALKKFPTEFYSNWQWWDVLRPSRVLDLDSMDPRPDSVVRMIDSFIGNRFLSVLFEARIGKGKLLVTSLDLSSDLRNRHAARQLRDSLQAYVTSEFFEPKVEIKPDAIDSLISLHQKKPARQSREEIKNRFDRKEN